MKIGLVLLAALAAVWSGCATPPDQQPAASAPAAAAGATSTAPTSAAPTRMRARATLTGSRLPPLDDDDPGTHSVGAVSREDYMHDDISRMRPLNGENPAAGF